MKWRDDKSWSDRFIPEIKAILGRTLIAVADQEDDVLRNSDLISLRLAGNMRIACRIRKHPYLKNYGDEFTLRCSRPSGTKTEIDKLLDGWGDFLFYGFANPTEDALAAWLIGDLSVFRRWIDVYHEECGKWPGQLKRNSDGSSAFVAFRIQEIDPEFIVARKGAHGNVLSRL